MSASVLEATLTALVAALNGGSRPVGVPAVERDRWIDIEAGPSTLPAFVLAGVEDDAESEQNEDRVVDFRRAKAVFEIYTQGSVSQTASQAADEIVQWLGKFCGTTEANALAATGAIRVLLTKRAAVVAKGNVCRCLVELSIEYRNLTNDLTRAR